MKRIRIIGYVLKQSFKSLVQNFFMFFASVVVVFSVLTLLGTILLATRNLQDVVRQFSDRPEVQINFAYYVTEDEAKEIMEEIRKDYRVQDVKMISKEENLNNLLSYYSDEKELFEAYKDSERLQYVTLEVDLVEYADGTGFVEQAKLLDGVDNVKDIVPTINKLEVVGFWMKIGTMIIFVAVICLSILLIFNTVKLTAYARKNEINIMKYIGATDSYILTPFVFEGVFTGIVGGICSFGIVRLIYALLFERVAKSGYLGTITLLQFSQAGGNVLLAEFLAFGVIIGLIASLWATAKYVKV